MDTNLTRRRFIAAACAGTASAGLAGQPARARPVRITIGPACRYGRESGAYQAVSVLARDR